MNNMELDLELTVDYIKLFIINMCVYYCFEKLLNIRENRLRNNIILVAINLVLLFIYIKIKSTVSSLLPFAILCFIYAIILSKLTKNKLGYSLIITIIAYAIMFVINTISVVIQFIPYKILEKFFCFDNIYVSLVIITFIQLVLLFGFFKIKRFKNGFTFLNNKLNEEVTDIIIINISAIIMMIYCLFIVYQAEIALNLFMMLIFLGITMFFTIQKMLTMYYKQKLLMDTMEQYKVEIAEKQSEIDKLKSEKQNVSKITHDFYNRQKALELLVASNMNSSNIDKENVSPNVLKIIESLTNEYSGRFEEIKELPKLEECEIPEIDNMFKYMQTECHNNNIDFKLKIIGNIHPLVNNCITKNRLETLIGDHLRDAINAVNLSELENKEILAILGIKNKKYELSIYDTGVDFEIGTLVKLGLERVTTNANRGGTGIGFMTTFETMNETKASLVITEYPMDDKRHYTKCVTIRFDGKKQYRICSYRAEEIKQSVTDNRIKIEEYTKSE